MIGTLDELAAVAYTLVGSTARPTSRERELARGAAPAETTIRSIQDAIRTGGDPLGDAFCRLRAADVRRERGATYTPRAIVDAMVAWAAAEERTPDRIVDAGAGSGRFTLAAAKAFPRAELVAVEIDPLAALMLRANATVLGFAHRLSVKLCDYRELRLPKIAGATLFIGNPPYVRHHDIEKRWKEWLSVTAARLGFQASALAGLHIHFFLKTRAIAREGDFGAFITASEWLDVNYGSLLRKMLADGLGGTAVHVIDAKARPFADAMATGTITCFRVGRRPDALTMRSVDRIEQLAPLSHGRSVGWDELSLAKRWSVLIRQSAPLASGEIEVGELFRVHRGQVTGCNEAWIAGAEAARLPTRFLIPTITKAKELLAAGRALRDLSALRKVVDLPPDLDGLSPGERRAVNEFLKWARALGADRSFIATHRRAWWSVGLREPAPILCTYMARRPPTFVRNLAAARHLNIAHGLYPIEPLSADALDRVAKHLSDTATLSGGRTYSGGLVKFEPGEVARLRIPEPIAFQQVR